MSAKELCDYLTSVGFQYSTNRKDSNARSRKGLGANRRDPIPEDFEWMFSDDQTYPYLSWLLEQLDPTTTLTSSELNAASELSANELVENFEVVDKTLTTLESHDESTIPLDTLELEVLELEKQAKRAQCRVKCLEVQRDSLSKSLRTVNSKAKQTNDIAESIKEPLSLHMRETPDLSERFDNSISDLYQVSKQSLSLYDNPASSSSLFSSVEFQNYQKIEKDALSTIKTQICEPNGETLEKNQALTENSSDVPTPTDDVEQRNKREFFESEIERLREGSPSLHRLRCRALSDEACGSLAVRLLTSSQSTILSEVDSISQKSLKKMESEIFQCDSELQSLRLNFSRLLNETLPLLSSQLSLLEVAPIFGVDSDEKLEHLAKHEKNQRFLLKKLLEQRGRFLLFLSCVSLEYGQTTSLVQLMQAAADHLETLKTSSHERLNYMEQQKAEWDAKESENEILEQILPQDHQFLSSIFRLLESSSSDLLLRSLTYTKESLITQVQFLAKQAAHTTIRLPRQEQHDELQSLLHRVISLLYDRPIAPSTIPRTLHTTPVFTPHEVTLAIDDLELGLESLTKAMEGVMKERANRMEQLTANLEEAQISRCLFVYFFARPEALPALLQHYKNKHAHGSKKLSR